MFSEVVKMVLRKICLNIKFIRESVNSLCRDDVDTPLPPYK